MRRTLTDLGWTARNWSSAMPKGKVRARGAELKRKVIELLTGWTSWSPSSSGAGSISPISSAARDAGGLADVSRRRGWRGAVFPLRRRARCFSARAQADRGSMPRCRGLRRGPAVAAAPPPQPRRSRRRNETGPGFSACRKSTELHEVKDWKSSSPSSISTAFRSTIISSRRKNPSAAKSCRPNTPCSGWPAHRRRRRRADCPESWLGKHGIEVKRFKGLGEMNSGELWETTLDPNKRVLLRVTLEEAGEAERLFSVLMGEDVERRRQFIEDHALEVKNLDV
jgi:hypothetical protein